MDLIERLIELEESGVRYQERASNDEAEYLHVPGQVPVLLSAPHGAVHGRDGRPRKEEDEYTAGLARLVAEMTGAHALYARRRSDTDPNYHSEAPYRDLLRTIVLAQSMHFVLDVHGASAGREFGIALGTIDGTSCPQHEDLIVDILEAHGFMRNGAGLDRLALNERYFTGGKDQDTITRYVSQELNLPAAQFEINQWLRVARRLPDASCAGPFQGDVRYIRRTVHALVALVHALAA
jgi:hypothetical protein